jgi:hypothetical protein
MCAARALDLCRELPQSAAILDLGCGVGGQTLQLADLTSGTIVAIDSHAPTMAWLDDDVAAIQDYGFELAGHFTLPDEAWWDDFYTPMVTRIAQLRGEYSDDVEASAILDQLAEEPRMHRRYSEYYAYEFFVARRPLH